MDYHRIALTAAAALILTSCTTTRYVDRPYPVPEIHTVHNTDTIREMYKDSTTVTNRNDTTYVDRWHTRWRDRWHERTVHDSIPYAVPDPYPVYIDKPYYDEDEMPWWKLTALYTGYITILIMLIKIIMRWKKR